MHMHPTSVDYTYTALHNTEFNSQYFSFIPPADVLWRAGDVSAAWQGWEKCFCFGATSLPGLASL